MFVPKVFNGRHLDGVHFNLLKVRDDDVAEDIKAALLERVGKVDEGAARSRVLDQQQHLRPPDQNVIKLFFFARQRGGALTFSITTPSRNIIISTLSINYVHQIDY